MHSLQARKDGDHVEEGRICNVIGIKYMQAHNYRLAIKYHSKDLQIAQATRDVRGSLVPYRQLGV